MAPTSPTSFKQNHFVILQHRHPAPKSVVTNSSDEFDSQTDVASSVVVISSDEMIKGALSPNVASSVSPVIIKSSDAV